MMAKTTTKAITDTLAKATTKTIMTTLATARATTLILLLNRQQTRLFLAQSLLFFKHLKT